MHEYKNSKLCKGFNVHYLPCEYIETCKLCTNYALDTRQGNNNELHTVFGIALACKRDNPEFVPYTREQFMEMIKNESDLGKSVEEIYQSFVDMELIVEE